MSKIDDFKQFVKNNPSLLKYVKNKEMTWQKFYEMYDLYGDSNEVCKEYIREKPVSNTVSALGVSDIINWIKNVDIDKMQESISSVQRVLGVLEDLGNNNTNSKHEYKPRPLYKHFED